MDSHGWIPMDPHRFPGYAWICLPRIWDEVAPTQELQQAQGRVTCLSFRSDDGSMPQLVSGAPTGGGNGMGMRRLLSDFVVETAIFSVKPSHCIPFMFCGVFWGHLPHTC